MPLPGDLAEPRLGLSDGQFRDLARSADTIYHAGAKVNFIYPYHELRAANVAGTREVIRLAAKYRGIPVHYVSSTAVLAGLGVSGVREVRRRRRWRIQSYLRMGYVETKYVAEELLRNAAGGAGLPVAIYRPLDIVGSVSTGAWSTSTEMGALIRFMSTPAWRPISTCRSISCPPTCARRRSAISRSALGAAARAPTIWQPEHAPLGSWSGGCGRTGTASRRCLSMTGWES